MSHINRSLITLVLSVAGLAGCASPTGAPEIEQYKAQFEKDPPTTEWLQTQTQAMRERAWAEPTKKNVEVFAFFSDELNKRQASETRQSNWQAQTHRILTNDWGNDGRGGAALRKPAYIHVLAGEATVFTTLHHPPASMPSTQALVASSLDKLQRGAYSVYELSRWERYCNHGKGMDKRDWAFVIQQGLNNVPTSLVGNCNPPAVVR